MYRPVILSRLNVSEALQPVMLSSKSTIELRYYLSCLSLAAEIVAEAGFNFLNELVSIYLLKRVVRPIEKSLCVFSFDAITGQLSMTIYIIFISPDS